MYIKRTGGESNLVPYLGALLEEYADVADLRVMGFPENWEEILN
jgi:hypothetical protein